MKSISGHTEKPNAFSGAKLLLFFGEQLLVILRDDKPGIPFPGLWDFPGGGREGEETPKDCVRRETEEEVGLKLAQNDLVWSRSFTGQAGMTWLFAAHLPAYRADRLQLGDEGQRLAMMTPEHYLAHAENIPHLAARLRLYMSENPGFS